MSTCMNILYMCWVFLTLLHISWSVTGGDVPGDHVWKCFDIRKKKKKNQLDGLETNHKFWIVLRFFIEDNANQNRWGFWSLLYPGLPKCPAKHLILQSSSEEKKKVPIFGLICIVDWTSCNIKSCLIKVQFACRTSLIVMAFKCQRIPSH